MYDVDRVYTPLFFVSFMIVVWLVILNMVIGIISAGFVSAKTKQVRWW